MTTALTPSPRQQFIDANGDPLASGKVYTYVSGTTTPLATYTTAAGNTANANPIILDSSGRAAIWLTSGDVYTFLVKTSADVLVYTEDGISASVGSAGLAASGGASLVGFIQSGSGAVATTMQEKDRRRVDVFDFMTDTQKAAVRTGTSTTDVSAAIQAAIDSLPAASGVSGRGGFEVLFPPGLYFIAAPINISGRWVSFLGSGAMQGPNGTTLRCTDSAIDMITATSGIVDSFSMKDMVLFGAGKGTGAGRGLVLGVNADATACCFSSVIENCWFTAIPDVGIDLQNSSDVRINGGAIENCAVGVSIAGSTYSGGQTVCTISPDTTIYGNTIGVEITSGIGNVIDGKFWFNGTSPGGAVDLVSGAIVIDHSGADAVRATTIRGTYIANVNDILIFGHNGSNDSNTGVNDTSIMGTHHYAAYGRVLYNDGANDTVFIPAKIDRPGQQADNTYDCVTNTGQSDGFVCMVMSQTKTTSRAPRYGLVLGASTTNTLIGPSRFQAGTAPYSIDAAATIKPQFDTRLVVQDANGDAAAQKYTIISQQDATHRMMLGVASNVGYVGSIDAFQWSLQYGNNQVGYIGANGLNQCDIGQSDAAKGKFTEIKYGSSNAIGGLTVTNYMDWKLADGTAVKVALVS